MSKLDEELKMMADLPDEITIGGKSFKIPPLTLGKIARLTDAITEIMPLLTGINEAEKKSPEELAGMLKDAINEVAAAFCVVTAPNDGQPIEINQSDRDFAKWNLQITQIPEIIRIVQKGLAFGELLKNVPSPRKSATSPGESSTAGSSASPNGVPITSPGGPL